MSKDVLEPCTLCKTAPALPESYVKLCQGCTDKVRQQLTDGKFLGCADAVQRLLECRAREGDPLEQLADRMLQPLVNLMFSMVVNYATAQMYGWGFDWMEKQCPRCGRRLMGVDCTCPPDGMVHCPSCIVAAHSEGCVLCKGTGYVEEL